MAQARQTAVPHGAGQITSEALTLVAEDGYALAAHYWYANDVSLKNCRGIVVINPATAVKASYYHRYARFLAAHGLRVLTYDYRGIGASRQGSLRNWQHITKRDWGRFDCEAALSWARREHADIPLYVVAHSIGGMTLGLAPSNRHVTRCLSVGAQFAYWPDYARGARLSMWLRWHFVMPLLTAALGYFPARALGWHEDLPKGAAYEWAFRGRQLRVPRDVAPQTLDSFKAMTGEILAIDIADDPFGTPAAVDRLLACFENCKPRRLSIAPAAVDESRIGHFAYFHERFRDTLWCDSLLWLCEGRTVHRFPHAVTQETAACRFNT